MAKMDGYPEARCTVPTNVLRPSRTARILTPCIVFSAVIILTAASITGVVVAASVYESASPYQPGESAAQVFVLIAVWFSGDVECWHVLIGVFRLQYRSCMLCCTSSQRLKTNKWES